MRLNRVVSYEYLMTVVWVSCSVVWRSYEGRVWSYEGRVWLRNLHKPQGRARINTIFQLFLNRVRNFLNRVCEIGAFNSRIISPRPLTPSIYVGVRVPRKSLPVSSLPQIITEQEHFCRCVNRRGRVQFYAPVRSKYVCVQWGWLLVEYRKAPISTPAADDYPN